MIDFDAEEAWDYCKRVDKYACIALGSILSNSNYKVDSEQNAEAVSKAALKIGILMEGLINNLADSKVEEIQKQREQTNEA